MIKINNKDIQNMVTECLNKLINEGYSYRDSGVFYEESLKRLESLVRFFTAESLDIDEDSDFDNISNFSDFIQGVIKLKEMSEAYQNYKRCNVYEIFPKYGWDRWEEFVSYMDEKYNYDFDGDEYISDYVQDFDGWNKYMPSMEDLETMIEDLKRWFNWYFDYQYEMIGKNLMQRKRYFIDTLNRII